MQNILSGQNESGKRQITEIRGEIRSAKDQQEIDAQTQD